MFDTLVHAHQTAVLLDTPHGPEHHVGHVDLLNVDRKHLTLHVGLETLLGGLHHSLVLIHLVVGQRQTGQRDEHVSGATLEPGITGQHIVLRRAVNNELMGAVDQRVVEVVARRADLHLEVGQLRQLGGLDFAQSGREDHALALLNLELEVAGHVEILVGGVAALLLFGILHSVIPVGTVDELVVLVHLHIEPGIPGVETAGDAVLAAFVFTVGGIVLVSVFSHRAERQEGLQAQRRLRMAVDQGVTDDDAVLEMLKHLLSLEDHAAHSVERGGHLERIEFSDVLVTSGSEVVTAVFMQSQVEFCTMLYDRGVQRREQHVILIVQLRHRHH